MDDRSAERQGEIQAFKIYQLLFLNLLIAHKLQECFLHIFIMVCHYPHHAQHVFLINSSVNQEFLFCIRYSIKVSAVTIKKKL